MLILAMLLFHTENREGLNGRMSLGKVDTKSNQTEPHQIKPCHNANSDDVCLGAATSGRRVIASQISAALT